MHFKEILVVHYPDDDIFDIVRLQRVFGNNRIECRVPPFRIIPDIPYTFGRGSLKFVFAATLTNCATADTKYTMKVSDVSTHVDPLCTVSSTSYTINFPIVAGASQWYWQATGSGVCVTEHYDLKVEVFSGNTSLTTATVGWTELHL